MKPIYLSRFTPSIMSPKTLEAIFVQREGLAKRIVELVRESACGGSKHHVLLVGPRGIGKTHLVALVYHRIRAMEDLDGRLLIAWLREEEWGITSLLDLFLRIFRALSAEYGDVRLDGRVDSLYDLPPEGAERRAGELLREFVGDRTLLVLMENLDEIFEGLGDEGQKRLRSYIQENPFWTILATAQSLFGGVSLRTSPFYGFFRIYHLEELDFEDAVLLLTKIASHEGDKELASFIQTPKGRARIRAVHHLAGGNHRVYIIFSQFLTRESLDELVESVLRMLDDLTPYYQQRMSWLSPQQRKIVEFLIESGHAVPVKEIAKRCFMTHQTASSQLKTLKEMGYVRSISIGRESYYELREPLMRLCIEVKKYRGEPIRLLVEFLRLWYSTDELRKKLESLQPEQSLEQEYLLYALRISQEEKKNPVVESCLRDYDAYIEKGEFARALEVAEELVTVRGDARDWLSRGLVLGLLGRYEEALESFDKAIELDPNNALAWLNRGRALYALGRHQEALDLLFKALHHFTGREEEVKILTIGIISIIININHTAWRRHVEALIEFYKKHNINILTLAVIIILPLPEIDDITAQRWLDTWRELAGNMPEFELPLRLLDAAVRYREKRDPRILLSLPIEERKLLESLLKRKRTDSCLTLPS